jgi:glycosyltransferase involved in cell wall biosynthesis
MKINEKPLISFCLFAYNQAKYIEEAVEGALNQTYKPLEIILSDDCSTDNTFDLIKEIVKSYKGPHKVIINRNKMNLGLAEHINQVVTIATGDWLVFAAGDDISLPERTSVLSKLTYDKEDVYFAGSGTIVINERGKPISNGVLEFNREIVLSGCAAAYHKKCFEIFEKLHPGVLVEDLVLPYRALLLGNIALINSPLVKYRILTKDYFESYKKYTHFTKSLENVFLQRNLDLKNISDRYPDNIIKTIKKINDRYIQIANKDYKNQKMIVDIYDATILSKIKTLINNRYFSKSQKIKMFLLSSKIIRIIYGHFLRYIIKTVYKSFTDEKITINLNDVLSKNLIIHVYNDIEI